MGRENIFPPHADKISDWLVDAAQQIRAALKSDDATKHFKKAETLTSKALSGIRINLGIAGEKAEKYQSAWTKDR
jgi:hypothetical protein